MMFDMVCVCGAAIHITADDTSERYWLFINRFSDAHVDCGFMTPIVEDRAEITKNRDIRLKDN